MMPDGFIKRLSQLTGCKYPGTLSSVVNLENTTSKYWPAVETLARETNPAGFAQWQAEQLQPAA
ncbi:hypothetical protein [Hymenobacter sp. B81]|uniref:hypothetical protein n=1 Tax=Hymenobacter sp. B81 TaxID=3344878 RepID=UPI0037DD6825